MPERVELRWWRGCPSWERARALVREEIELAGLDPSVLSEREIIDDDEAAAIGFPGSPTILVDGIDIQEPGRGTPRGLTCRIYRTRDGRVSPLPDREDLREALTRPNPTA